MVAVELMLFFWWVNKKELSGNVSIKVNMGCA